MSETKSLIQLINNMSNVYDIKTKKTFISYNKLILKRFINYYIIIFKIRELLSFLEILNHFNNIDINTKHINNNDIDFFNNFISNNATLTNNTELNEFILINNIKEKITNKNIFTQFINDIKHLLVIDDIESLKKIDDFFDNYESLLCTVLKQSESFSGPFVDVYKVDNNKIKEINDILENYKTKKKITITVILSSDPLSYARFANFIAILLSDLLFIFFL